MNAVITDRGRGPELAGTRVTVYRIMDFVREGSTAERMAHELDLTLDQVNAALDYVRGHAQELEPVYLSLLQRAQQGNPAWVEAGRASSPDELRARLNAQRTASTSHDRNGR